MNSDTNHIPNRYFIINKPYDMVSQFVSPHEVRLLGDLNFDFPEGTHAIGRLDNNSEGLLILTTNKKITRLLFSNVIKHKRVYLVQVNNLLSEENANRLRNGVSIRVEGGGYYTTPPCEVNLIKNPETIYPYIKNTTEYGVHTWFTISLYEGKFRQVRKMTGAIHHRCKRLIRVSIEDLSLGKMKPGEVREMKETDFFKKLQIKKY